MASGGRRRSPSALVVAMCTVQGAEAGPSDHRRPLGRLRSPPMSDPYALADEAAAALAERTGVERHDVAVVLGSGWRPAADRLGEVVADVAMAELGGFPASSVAGHGSTVRSVANGDRRVLVFTGRVHLYEGNHVHQ